ncbi:shikimate kinase [Micrococcales bacterium 31B]|nr:shikimate kinase [Micrococcales bacterium 31B]
MTDDNPWDGLPACPRVPSSDRALVILMGPMGAGKTTIGKIVARKLGVELLDTDHLVESRENRTIADIFAMDGEQTFRDLEHEAVRDAIAQPNTVVSLGGGAPLRTDTQAILRDHLLVFLDVSALHASRRVGSKAGTRPLLAGDAKARWIEMMRTRRPIYESLASFRVLTDTVSPEQAADIVIEEIRHRALREPREPEFVEDGDGVEPEPADDAEKLIPTPAEVFGAARDDEYPRGTHD